MRVIRVCFLWIWTLFLLLKKKYSSKILNLQKFNLLKLFTAPTAQDSLIHQLFLLYLFVRAGQSFWLPVFIHIRFLDRAMTFGGKTT